ncbi:MAG: hypothetical protein WA755_17020 [Candidatus Acidiferrales bacterium]
MNSVSPIESDDAAANSPDAPAPANAFTALDIENILREQSWLAERASNDATRDDNDARSGGAIPAADSAALANWLEEAAALLGPHAIDRGALVDLLGLIFRYDAATTLASADAQSVIARSGAREVIRELAGQILESGEIRSERFKEMIDALKVATRIRSRELFHPVRLALAGRAGEGELDRVILLLDSAAKLDFAVHVKGTRERMLEFCAALD